MVNVELKIKQKRETDEWAVVWYEDGKRIEEKCYYTKCFPISSHHIFSSILSILITIEPLTEKTFSTLEEVNYQLSLSDLEMIENGKVVEIITDEKPPRVVKLTLKKS